MPHINRIRVNNVKYNFGTQFYDDFVMRFDGRNAMYDLANGGGKSVLMLLLFQNLIPNCTLDDKQPVEKLFRTGDGSTTIHSLVEWKLDEKDIKDDFKYMLTGFCARKARDDGGREKNRDVASVDYYNYVIFYREYNDNDIINLPLKKDGERITYTGLKTYLKDLGRSDYHLDVHIFERKGEYQRFISRYGLYESAWEIIRGINKTEGHVRTWFETHYRTTRKVVEDLLIEEIIQKAFFMKDDHPADTDMAQTLLEIKDKLLELSRKKEEISVYERQTQALESFAGRIETLDNLYDQEQSFFVDLVKTYNTSSNVIRQKEKELNLAEKEKALLARRSQDAARKLDTVKIQQTQERLKTCTADTGKYEQQLEQMRARRNEKQLELNLKQSINHYLDYMDYKNKAETVRQVLEHAGSDDSGILEKLSDCAARQKVCFAQNANDWNQELKALKKQVRADETERMLHEEQCKALEKTLAVAQSEAQRAEGDEKRLQAQISRLRREINALMAEGSAKELRSHQIKLRKAQEEMDGKKAQIETLKNHIHELLLRREGIRVEAKNLETQAQEFADFENAWKQKKARADKLMEFYHTSDYHQLRSVIYERWEKVVIDLFRKREEIQHQKTVRRQLGDHQPMVADEALLKIMDHIRRCHGVTCILGSDYLSGLEGKERRRLLEEIPYLPCAIIVQDGFSRIREDHILAEGDYGENVYPIIGLDTVLGENLKDTQGHVLFLTKNKALFYDDGAVRDRIRQLDTQLSQAQKEADRLEDTGKTYMADAQYVGEFIVDYHDKYMARLGEAAQNREKQAALQKEADEIQAALGESSALQESLQQEIASLQKDWDTLKQEEEVLKELVALESSLSEAGARRIKNEGLTQKTLEELSQLKNTMSAAADKAQACRKRIDHIKELLEAQEKDWKQLYEPYDRTPEETGDEKAEAPAADDASADAQGQAAAVADEAGAENTPSPRESSDAIAAEFLGLKEVYEKEHTDLEDKRKLLETYEQGMARMQELIHERGMSEEELAGMYEKDQTQAVSREELEDLRNTLEKLSGEIQELIRTAAQVRDHKNRLEGTVENAIDVVKEKYGEFKEVEISGNDYSRFMEDQEQLLTSLKDQLAQQTRETERLIKELRSAEDTRKDLERLMRTARVTYNLTRDFYADGSGLRRRFDELCDRYERLKNDAAGKQEAFERSRDQLADLMQELKAFELADEIRYHMELPKDRQASAELSGRIRETIQIILLEKDRISRGMADMLKIKESFEDQCLQRCLDIRTQLERLPGLSKITLDGKQVPMVQLKIPYVREEQYRQRMSDYIDGIVAGSDTYEAFDEKLRYIRQKLSWKNLFSVIVTDMNGIRLNLYKRERIHEQSRYLRYEEAVGSTGQSQGIYIQFLIAVINYISAVNSFDTDAASSKKVLFIDNPFGAAKDIYIWEPIFELLKTNNVQLIVPARGATPAISGMFDVNYVLGQKMIDGKVQTVVVDYYSNIKIDDVEYVKIDFEQEVFDFI